MASSLFEVFSSGPKTRKLSMFAFITSRRKAAQRPGVLGLDLSRLLHLQRVVAEVGQAQRLLQDVRRWRADWRSCGGCRWAPVLSVPESACHSASNSSSGFCVAHPVFQDAQLLGILLHVGHAAPGARAKAFQPVAADFLRCASSLWESAARSWASAAAWPRRCARHSC